MPKRPSSLSKNQSQYTENLSEDVQTSENIIETLTNCKSYQEVLTLSYENNSKDCDNRSNILS